MKKVLIFAMVAGISLGACKKDDDNNGQPAYVEPENISTQNTNDDAAIAKYLDEHYLNSQGKIMSFTATETPENHPRLSSMNPLKLSSGVVVILREGAQPENGRSIGDTDIIRIMHHTGTFLSNLEDGKANYISELVFGNTIDGSGAPQNDPSFYFASAKTLSESGKARDFYEIEGFREGLKHFKSCEIPDSQNYNLQGVIIVPSRAAFARDAHYPYGSTSWRNRNFVFNFQVYKTSERK